MFRPILIALMMREGSDDEDVNRAVLALESFLLRRMVCGLQTRGYGTLALELLKSIAAAGDAEPATPGILNTLSGEVGTPAEWPDDESFKLNWMTRRFYGWFKRDRVLMILQAVEEHYQKESIKAEPVVSFDFSKLTIEHIMPQAWATNWPLPSGEDIMAREAAVQNIGNLTLVSDRLNQSLSNAAWHSESQNCKRAGLAQHSRLELNRRLLQSFERWDEDAISRRAAMLFDAGRKIWPSREAFLQAS